MIDFFFRLSLHRRLALNGIVHNSVLFLYNENKRILILILPEGDRMVGESGGALHDFLKEISLIILESRVSFGG